MRVAGLQFFLILIFQMCFTANALDLSLRTSVEENLITAALSQSQNSEPLEERSEEEPAPNPIQETVEDDDFEVWHESNFLLSTLNLVLYSHEIEQFHRGPYLSGLYRPPCFA